MHKAMTKLTVDAIHQLLPAETRRIFIGYSGGVDSHVLLHLAAADSRLISKITAVYIHHGLQLAADDWERHCQQQCLQLDVCFEMIQVNAAAASGESPEAAAREARYRAFASLLQEHDVLLLAQHREDQLETLLLQLFRGSGLYGLAAMPVTAPFAKGTALRPLLAVAKADILDYARQHALQWVEDPSNHVIDYDRNFLRNQILPVLKQRWPSLDKTVSRTARHCANAAQLLDDWADQNLPGIIDPLDNALLIDKWQEHPENQRIWLLRSWLQHFNLKPSSEAILQAIIRQVIHARADANPDLHTQGWYIKKYRTKLYCVPQHFLQIEQETVVWPAHTEALALPNGYQLLLHTAGQGIPKQLWDEHKVEITYRRGGEKLQLPGRQGHHCLKKLFQEAGIPPWERSIRPLIYIDGKLAAVAGLWVDERVWGQGDCYALSWRA
jgi:tRNA(Ile)-lysidine synthase